MARRFLEEHGLIAGQVIRFAMAGGAITVAVALSYWLLAEFARLDPNLAFTITFLFFSMVSYLVHGRYSFRDHGKRDRPLIRQTRFLIVNLIGFAVNQLWVWLLVKHLGGANWWPTVPIVLLTPWLTFFLHRRWVYA